MHEQDHNSVAQTSYINCSNQSLPSPPFALHTKVMCIALKLNGTNGTGALHLCQ